MSHRIAELFLALGKICQQEGITMIFTQKDDTITFMLERGRVRIAKKFWVKELETLRSGLGELKLDTLFKEALEKLPPP